MKETFHRTLEQFRYPTIPFLYIVDDQKAAKSIAAEVMRGPYGIEFGIGNEPTRYYHIDRTIPWIGTDIDESNFEDMKILPSHLRLWSEESANMTITQPIMLLHTAATPNLIKNAQIIIYRNIDYRYSNMIRYHELKPYQRLIFIVNSTHISHMNELGYYQQFLARNDYNPNLLIPRPESTPSFTYPYPWNETEFVLDMTKT